MNAQGCDCICIVLFHRNSVSESIVFIERLEVTYYVGVTGYILQYCISIKY